MQANPCPFEGCSGSLFVRRFGGINAFGCDGPEQHTDSQVLNALQGELGQSIARDESASDEILRRCDPVAWILDQVEAAKRDPEVKITDEDLADFVNLPEFSTGLVGSESNGLISLRGMVTLSGDPSSGKTWFALGAALNSALAGWDVHYVAAEAEDVIKRRIHRAFGDASPPKFHLHSVEPGLRVDDILDRLSQWIVSTRTLLVLDSLSTLMSFMKRDHRESQWDAQGRVETFLMGLRKFTRGDVSIINISETNARGEAKGRTINYRSDMAIHFKGIDDSDAKEIRVVKAWESSIGMIGRAMVDAEGPGLSLIYNGPNSSAPDEDAF